jgi:uncharacterized membrane protein
LLFTVLPAGAIYSVYSKIHTQEREMLEQDGKAVYTDDDEYWVNGQIYYNPQDKSTFVPKRVGFGET